jgi:hypothetical protein
VLAERPLAGLAELGCAFALDPRLLLGLLADRVAGRFALPS